MGPYVQGNPLLHGLDHGSVELDVHHIVTTACLFQVGVLGLVVNTLPSSAREAEQTMLGLLYMHRRSSSFNNGEASDMAREAHSENFQLLRHIT